MYKLRFKITGDLTIEEGLNHTAIVDMVSEGVCATLADHEPPELEQVNNVYKTENLQAQLNEMYQIIERMNNTQQVSQPLQHQNLFMHHQQNFVPFMYQN